MWTRLCLVLILVSACGDETETTTPPPPAAADAGGEAEPTEEQKRALANPLHHAHVEAEEEPVQCRECHRIEGAEKPTKQVKHRCLSCHEENTSAVHQKVEDRDARECLSCHEFLEAKIDPWACAVCHVEGTVATSNGASEAQLRLRQEALRVGVHEKDCDRCHVPHGEEALSFKTCLECHEDQQAKHASADPKGRTSKLEPEQCVECHGGHEPASAAVAKCATCHDKPPATTFEGHDECMTCHKPHSATGKETCFSCHQDQQTLGAAEHLDHKKCRSCHRPHDVKRDPHASCWRCHDEQTALVRVTHPKDDRPGSCVGCHPQHPVEGRPLAKAEQCTACHEEEAKGDDKLHAGTDCRSCHEPHEFDLKAAGTDLCASCHVGQPATKMVAGKQVTQVQPMKAHGECVSCHVKGNHSPQDPPVACGQCHEPQQQAAPLGHAQCASCHDPHAGGVEKTCADCHEQKVGAGRHAPKVGDCAKCHEAHASRPRGQAKLCVTCHEPPLPLLHQSEGHSQCENCHGFHDADQTGERASCLGACHQELVDHEPQAPKCTGCHPFEQAPKEVRR